MCQLNETRNLLRREYERRERVESPLRTVKQDDLVLLRRLNLNQVKGRKLEARWSGPYRVRRVTNYQRSVILEDLQTRITVGKHHINNMKLFCKREKYAAQEEGSQQLRDRVQEQRRVIEAALKERRRTGVEGEIPTDQVVLTKALGPERAIS